MHWHFYLFDLSDISIPERSVVHFSSVCVYSEWRDECACHVCMIQSLILFSVLLTFIIHAFHIHYMQVWGVMSHQSTCGRDGRSDH